MVAMDEQSAPKKSSTTFARHTTGTLVALPTTVLTAMSVATVGVATLELTALSKCQA